MKSRTALRRELRHQGAVLPGCPTCPLAARCGGMKRQRQLFVNTCFDQHCCGKPDTCEMVCMKNHRWERDLRDHGNLLFNNLPSLTQQGVELPAYVPLIDHRIADLGGYRNVKKKEGQIRWDGPLLAGGKLILVSSEGEIAFVNPADGKTLSRRKVGAPMSLPPVAAGGMLYVLTEGGRLIAYR